MIEPFIGKKIQEFYQENSNKVDDSVIMKDSITENDIKQHDLFSIAFIILHTQIPDLPSVFNFYKESEKQLISFDFDSFLQKIDKFFNSLMYEEKFVKILKRMIDYEGLKKSRLIYNFSDFKRLI